MSGNLIVLEGLDGSGKATQAALLKQSLATAGKPVHKISFPDYDSPSSTLVKMYLQGEIGELGQVNVYAATSFYAADRYISYQTQWKPDYERGDIIIADRYTTSNIIYQMAKLPEDKWQGYLEWITDYEFEKLGLPAPDTVLYLKVEPTVSQALLAKRYAGDESKKDLHESNLQYLLCCHEVAQYAAQALGWKTIDCSQQGELLSIEAISRKIDKALQL